MRRVCGFAYLFILLGYSGVPVGGSCPDGFCRHSGGCYLVVGLNVTWIDAWSYCSALGGRMLSISTSSEQLSAAGALMRSKGTVQPGSFWLDTTDLLNPKDWKYMYSRSSISYSNWDLGYDVIETVVQNCVYISDATDYYWKPTPCDMKMNFVCYASGRIPDNQDERLAIRMPERLASAQWLTREMNEATYAYCVSY